MKLSTLIKRAQAASHWRGHRLKWVKGTCDWQRGEYATGKCIKCDAYVQCLTHPAPNDIDVGGSAVALNCPIEKVKSGLCFGGHDPNEWDFSRDELTRNF
jgi:hypothetical protein